ncbi:MAG: DUF4340 domain-containing protein [Akkermansiaceae bacterium]
MKSRTVIILWAIALILAASVFALKKSQGNSDETATKRSPGEKLLSEFPADKTATIWIKGAENSVQLSKKDGTWKVVNRDNFPADARNINDLIRTIAEVKVTQGIEAGPTFAPRFGMDADSADPEKRGLKVILEDASETDLAIVSFGKNLDANSSSPFGGGSTGRFVRNHSDESGFYAVSELFSTLSSDPKEWLADEFFKVERIQTISLDKPGSDENEWTITRDDESAEFKFSEAFPGVKIDPAAVTPLKSLFSYARFDDVVPAADIEKRSNPEKLQNVKISTFEGLTYNITLQPAKPLEAPKEDEAPTTETFLMTVSVSGEIPEKRNKAEGETEEDAQAADKAFKERTQALSKIIEDIKKIEDRTFEVSRFTVDALLKERADLMDKGEGPAGAKNPPTPGPGQFPGVPSFNPPVEIPMKVPQEAPPSEQQNSEE